MLAKEKKEPLLYINQPNIHYPEVNMQSVFSSKKTKVEEEVQPEVTAKVDTFKEEKRTEEVVASIENKQDVIEEYDEQQSVQSNPFSKERKSSFTRLKSFKEMTVLERLHYLDHFPKQLPPVACIFESTDSSVKGFLVNKTDFVIDVKTFNNNVETLDIRDLISVKMIGLR
ncbi:CotO family spore coat protein [Cytobacillus gottheilii]|uniref:CotO family spore coat protein n=1 Tax=Cytobacillus gottheilii TaxID=859144 RepID=UPI0009BAA935|nr:CotO family spore coat protein [Cytobacillus gottheilii]